MKLVFLLTAVLFFSGCSNTKENSNTKISAGGKMEDINIHDVSVKDMDGKSISLSDYKGKVLLIVNVASQCGNTPQYEGLQAIYEKYKDRGFEILGFPSNDFGGQEPGTNDEIRTFCESKYNVTFPLFDKVQVLGESKSPLYAKLINANPSGDVKWNFEKFLIDKNGNVTERFGNKVKPEADEVTAAVERELEKQ